MYLLEFCRSLPDAQLLLAPEVTFRIAGIKPLQRHITALGKQPVGTLPVHLAVIATFRFPFDVNLGDDPLGYLDRERFAGINVGMGVRSAPGLKTGIPVQLLALPAHRQPVREVLKTQVALLYGGTLLQSEGLPSLSAPVAPAAQGKPEG